jgi:hypothetical protein
MRAKNEFKFLAEAYDTKLILERVVDGKLMCPEACCGSPVMECKCGPDCEHCNCHEIQKLAKKEEDEESLAESKWETARDVAGSVARAGWELGKAAGRAGFEVGKYGAEKGYKAYKKRKHGKSAKGMAEKNEKEIRELEQKEADRDRLVKSRQRLKELKGEDDTDKGQYAFEDAEDLSGGWESSRDRAGEMEAKEEAMRKKIERIRAKRKDKESEDNEGGALQPKVGITGLQHTDALARAALNPKRSPELHSMKSHAIDEIDLNKWREYPAEDVMKAVYRRYGKELPSVDSYDWAITWDKKVRPWLKEHEGNL